jgi:hypothetical protein
MYIKGRMRKMRVSQRDKPMAGEGNIRLAARENRNREPMVIKVWANRMTKMDLWDIFFWMVGMNRATRIRDIRMTGMMVEDSNSSSCTG